MLYLLLLASLIVYYLNLGFPQVWMPNESFYADASRRMLETKDFITPYYNGELRLEKPPMTYWIVSLGYSLFGINEFGLRFFHASLGILTGVITSLLAYEVLKNLRLSILSGLILILSFQFFANARYASPEVPFTFFITLTLYLWLLSYKRKSLFLLILAYVSSSLAVMTKGPAGFILPAGVVFLYLLITDPKELLKKRYYALTLIFLPLSLWWHVWEFLTHREQFLEVFYRENIKRVYGGNDPVYFYLLDTLISFLPYSFVFFFAITYTLLKVKRELGFFVVWFGVIFAFFSVVKSKIPVYVLPSYPAMAVITASFLLSEDWERVKRYSLVFLSFLISLLIPLIVLYLGLPKFYLLLALPGILLLFKDYKLAPLLAGISFFTFANTGLVNYLENFRHYREIGNLINTIDSEAKRKTYEVGYFHHNLPFYAKREIIRDQTPQKGSIVIFKLGSFPCEPIKVWNLYTSSESRLVSFILDTKRGKRFEPFGICIYE